MGMTIVPSIDLFDSHDIRKRGRPDVCRLDTAFFVAPANNTAALGLVCSEQGVSGAQMIVEKGTDSGDISIGIALVCLNVVDAR
jgi:hypothetical protein